MGVMTSRVKNNEIKFDYFPYAEEGYKNVKRSKICVTGVA